MVFTPMGWMGFIPMGWCAAMTPACSLGLTEKTA